jgi:hypothetical protein
MELSKNHSENTRKARNHGSKKTAILGTAHILRKGIM